MADDLEAAAADDRAPFLATPAGPAASGGSSARRWRCCSIDIGASRRSRVASRVSRVLSSADVRVACRGLALLLLLLVVGGVGSVAMRQMVSPEINALMRERQDLRQGLELLKLQLDNMTRIADSRLDMIHLLESELERQAVQAAEAAANYPLAGSGGLLLPAEGRLAAGGALQRGRLASTVFYTWLLGSVVFLFVLYRIVRIMQAELQAQQKLARADAGQDTPPSSDHEASSPPRPPRGVLWDYHATTTASSRAAATTSSKSRGNKAGNAALSPTNGQGAEASPQCYKRPQGSSPVDRYIV